MTSRTPFPAIALPLLLALALLAACGGGDNEPTTIEPSGQLTDPRSVPTATPWAEPPEVTFLEPGGVTPNGEGDGNGQVTPGVCGETYIVQAGDYPALIAEKCGVDVNELMQVNGIDDPRRLQVGQELTLP